MTTAPPPLAGVRVLELGQYIAVPGATQILADQGATVIKVEAPGGEPSRNLPGYGAAMVTAYNRNKHLVELDLKSEEGRQDARSLALSCDIVMANFRPGALARLGLDAQTLRAERPELIHVSFTGFGSEGSMRTRAGLDIAAQAEAGIMWVTGEQDAEPQRVGFPVVDAAATFAISQAATAALLGKAHQGVGASIEISLWDVAIALQAPNWMELALTGVEPVRKGNGQPSVAPAAELVRVADGWVVLSAYMEPQWRRLCELIGATHLLDDPRFATSPARVRHRDEMHVELTRAFGPMTREKVVELLDSAGLVCGSVNSYSEAKELRDGQPSSPFVPIEDPHEGDPAWLLGPLTRWWDSLDVHVPRPSGTDNHRLSELITPHPVRSTS